MESAAAFQCSCSSGQAHDCLDLHEHTPSLSLGGPAKGFWPFANPACRDPGQWSLCRVLTHLPLALSLVGPAESPCPFPPHLG